MFAASLSPQLELAFGKNVNTVQRKLFVRASDGLARVHSQQARSSAACGTCHAQSRCVCAKVNLPIDLPIAAWDTIGRQDWPTVITWADIAGPYQKEWAPRVTPLTIKVPLTGSEMFIVDGRPVLVDPHSYLIINEGTTYASLIDLIDEFRTASIFLSPQLFDEVVASSSEVTERLLDGPVFAPESRVRFIERLYPHDQLVSPVIFRLLTLFKSGASAMEIENAIYELAEHLLGMHNRCLLAIEQLRFMKPSTRMEVYKRLAVCHDYMLSNLAEKLTLRDIAETAGFSTHHFLRIFREVYGTTPHRYLTQVRLERARNLLHSSTKTVIQVCGELGFESVGTFSTLYKARFGMPPTLERKLSVL